MTQPQSLAPIIGEAGLTQLMHCAAEGDLEGCRRLLDQGVDVNQRDDKGATALIYAALNNCVDIISLLLSKGANQNLASKKNGLTALSIAKKNDFHEIVKLLDSGHSAKWKSPFIPFIAITIAMYIGFRMVSLTLAFVVEYNVAVTAIALTIGYYSLGIKGRQKVLISHHAWLFAVYIPLALIGAVIAHDAKIGNQQSMAPMGNTIYAIVLAIVAYQIASHVGLKNFSKEPPSA